MDIIVDQIEHPTLCYLQPHDGPKVVVCCAEPKGHTTPHSWEKAGYTREGWYMNEA